MKKVGTVRLNRNWVRNDPGKELAVYVSQVGDESRIRISARGRAFAVREAFAMLRKGDRRQVRKVLRNAGYVGLAGARCAE